MAESLEPVRDTSSELASPGHPPGAAPDAGVATVAPTPAKPVTGLELLAGFVVLVLWFLLFAGGILIPTDHFRDEIGAPDPAVSQPTTAPSTRPTTKQVIGSAFAVLLFWTITNVGLLSCLAAFLGAVGRRTRFAMQGMDFSDPNAIPNEVPLHYASAIIRGFGIYGLMMAGLLVLATDTFSKPTQGQYLRLAATVSVISFYAGYDPSIFAGVLVRVKRLLDQSGPGGAR